VFPNRRLLYPDEKGLNDLAVAISPRADLAYPT
jgi:hypothetical protein